MHILTKNILFVFSLGLLLLNKAMAKQPNGPTPFIDTEAKENPLKDTLPITLESNGLDQLSKNLNKPTTAIPNYNPFLHDIGIRANWLGLVSKLWNKAEKTIWTGGLDFRILKYIQLAIDLGYEEHHPKKLIYGNQNRYQTYGKYALLSIQYVIKPNLVTNAYLGISYGQSHFDLINETTKMSSPQTFLAHFIKLQFSSEIKLLNSSSLYGGLSWCIARLLASKKAKQMKQTYTIPGYGSIENKNMNLSISPYITWRINLLERSIIP